MASYIYTERKWQKDKIAYVCSHCGQESAKWLGKCPSCGQWNTFKEIRVGSDTGQQAARSAASELRTHPSRSHRMRLGDIAAHDEPRIDMIDGEFNRVLGGGLVLAASCSWAANRALARAPSPSRPFCGCRSTCST